ncbi:TilS substrate-binding domain-containing protein, partial [Bordetella pertussis]|uniref:TilS substrate-binding domain-containing protein n=1 Tax=Bordetella pertussis TaxID=520 RepID=UPI00366CA7BC
WRALSVALKVQAWRHGLTSQDAPMPTEARLAELQRQLRQLHALGHDRHLRWQHAGRVVRCERGRVWIDD